MCQYAARQLNTINDGMLFVSLQTRLPVQFVCVVLNGTVHSLPLETSCRQLYN